MPVTRLGSVTIKSQWGSGTMTASHTVNGETSMLVVLFGSGYGDGDSGDASWVKWDGTSLTKLAGYGQADPAFASLWYLANPVAKTANIEVSAPAVGATNFFTAINYGGSLTGSAWSGTTGGWEYNVSSTYKNITGSLGGMIVDGICAGGESWKTISPNSGQTQLSNHQKLDGAYHGNQGTSEKQGTGSATTMGWTFNGNMFYAYITSNLIVAPRMSGNAIWIMAKLLDDLKKGLIPPWELKRRYRQVWAI